jgi:hypothetical protein
VQNDPGSTRFFLPLLREGVAAEGNPGEDQLYGSPYTFPPTRTSTLAWSSGFHVASPIHAVVSPR